MSTSSTTTWHLECDLCHAAGDEAVSDHEPPLPEDWRRLKNFDICPACIGRMTFQDFVTRWDEAVRQTRMEQQGHWAQPEKMLQSTA